MVPERFVTEYPARCRQLLDILEAPARKADLVGSFALLVASAAFTIPFARMVEKAHPLGAPEDKLYDAVEGLKKQSFADAKFWQGAKPGFFRYAKIVTEAENSVRWRNAKGEHPLASSEMKDANIILRTIRNALAHGNVVYLDKDGYETPGNRLVYLAFLSRHEGDGYRVAIFDEETFLAFLKAWIGWLQTFPPERELKFAEAAE
ncbi:hypothetical protein LB533_25695 [Mesorhizobium sp. BR1-1-13]|uniref:hypothetical protein n=1 Tax=Mesorhizobium sp. BR1-1-13 TaxID=2876656 RepID=UPI001CD16DB2|nr:hypothetical protein [Mesorhizobium sp. BR1-1-13]MBZ9944492.1 hypothetical protein [Mesorhizobium sp. BR1-1-13]